MDAITPMIYYVGIARMLQINEDLFVRLPMLFLAITGRKRAPTQASCRPAGPSREACDYYIHNPVRK